ncbi:MAG: hypothetical protein HOV94_36835, partial [Saccharothrix sp.]|nr:hypothetical protein [Saccharothrix sp.]
LRVLPDAVAALRDGVEVTRAAVALPWTTARARMAFRQAQGTQVDAFAVGGVPGDPAPGSVLPLGPGMDDHGVASLGNVTSSRLAGASSVRVVASVVAERDGPVTVDFGSRSAPAVPMTPGEGLHPYRATVVHADFPLPPAEPNPPVRVRSDSHLTAHDAYLVIADGPDTRLPPPRLTDRALPEPEVPTPSVSVLHESADDPAFPPRGDLRLVVELADARARGIAPIKGLEVHLDGERIAVLPTNGSAGGRHEFRLDLARLSSGQHDVQVRVLPMDERRGVREYQQTFTIRPL